MSADVKEEGSPMTAFGSLFDEPDEYAVLPPQARGTEPPFSLPDLPQALQSIISEWNGARGDTEVGSGNEYSHVTIGPTDELSLRDMLGHTWAAGHPEQPSRLLAIFNALHAHLWVRESARWACTSGRLATYEEITLVHTPTFVQQLRNVEAEDWSLPTAHVLNLTYAGSPLQAVIASRIATGTLIDMCITATSRTSVVNGCVRNANTDGAGRRRPQLSFALTRPAGHHSVPDRTGPFCAINCVAVAAAVLAMNHGKRVAIVDIDIHRSGGSEVAVEQLNAALSSAHSAGEHAAELDERTHPAGVSVGSVDALAHVLVASKVMLVDLYGRLEGKAPPPATLSIETPIRMVRVCDPITDECMHAALAAHMPALHAHVPDVILVSAGFDAARGDKEGGFVTPSGFAALFAQLFSVGCPVVAALEGGYDEDSLASSISAVIANAAVPCSAR